MKKRTLPKFSRKVFRRRPRKARKRKRARGKTRRARKS